ncbi:hypothetical protein A1F94_008422 [Pyrenophora tritici-repentis]|nr:hypothetical protein A1F94_008422 [Pyrenophora tritici-repentis]
MKAAFSASQQGYPLKDAFILDSGSTTHICNDLSRIEDTEDLMDNHAQHPRGNRNWVRTVELPGTQSQQAETETFYEDDTTQEESPRTQKTRYHQGRKVVEAYLTPPPTPPPVALLVQGEVNNEDMTNMSNQSTSMTSPWAAAFMAGTESGHIANKWASFLDQLGLVKRKESPLKEAELEKLQEHLEGLYM